MIPMGFAMHLEDEGLAALVVPRSGLGSKHGIVPRKSCWPNRF